MYIGLHVKYRLFLSDANEIWIFSIDFGKINIKFNENPAVVNRHVPCERRDGQTDVTKLIVAYRNFATAPKNGFPANITLSLVGLWGIGHCDH